MSSPTTRKDNNHTVATRRPRRGTARPATALSARAIRGARPTGTTPHGAAPRGARATADRPLMSLGTGSQTVWTAPSGVVHAGARRRAARADARLGQLLNRVDGFLQSGLTSDRDFQAMVGRWVDHWDQHNWTLLHQFGAQGRPARPRSVGANGQALAREARAYLLARAILLSELQRFLNTLP